jgi:hypothetical protein
MYSFQNTGRNQIRNRLAYSDPADAEAYHQRPLRRNSGARVQLSLDQVLEDAADLRAFGGC